MKVEELLGAGRERSGEEKSEHLPLESERADRDRASTGLGRPLFSALLARPAHPLAASYANEPDHIFIQQAGIRTLLR
jgi:hypothetical protein